MLYFLFYLKDQFILFNVFKYITFRSFGAGVTAFLICLFLGGRFINFLKEKQFRENIRSDGPPGHIVKEGTPTMGGTFIVLAIIFSTVLWVNLSNTTIIIAICQNIIKNGNGRNTTTNSVTFARIKRCFLFHSCSLKV